jgi:hypothetical protein
VLRYLESRKESINIALDNSLRKVSDEGDEGCLARFVIEICSAASASPAWTSTVAPAEVAKKGRVNSLG